MEEILKQLNLLNKKFDSLKYHQHNRYDSSPIEFDNLIHKKLYISHCLVGSMAATAANYGVFYIVPKACVITGFQEVHQVAGTDAGAVTLNLEKLTGTEAPGSGSEVLSTDLSLKSTINSVQSGVLTMTLADKTLKIGDRLCLKDTGTLTDVSNITVMVQLIIL